ncbi:hypothetical protein HDU83_000829 [Entophlyctis luteolus]|nr:hypothetical protein HDU83_000829 [Entophlyctis luteolus]
MRQTPQRRTTHSDSQQTPKRRSQTLEDRRGSAGGSAMRRKEEPKRKRCFVTEPLAVLPGADGDDDDDDFVHPRQILLDSSNFLSHNKRTDSSAPDLLLKSRRNSATRLQSRGPSPTPEQSAIIEFARSLPAPAAKNNMIPGTVCRIVAGAGTGKTTTLCMLAEALARNGHHILYLVYNKAAQNDAQARFKKIGKVTCCTMHAAALRFLRRPTPDFEINPVDDVVVRMKIDQEYETRASTWLAENWRFETNSNRPSQGPNQEKMTQLVLFYIFKTLEGWYRSAKPLQELHNTWNTYYPAKIKHRDLFDPGTFYIDAARDIWTRMWNGNFPICHDAYLKYAQLNQNIELPASCSVILVDESQDASACQLDLFVTQPAKSPHVKPNKHIFIVGDAAQSIYYFRGARPKELAQIDNQFESLQGRFFDFHLRRSFRFGPVITRAANMLLWIKANSPQAKDFNPYVVVGVSKVAGKVLRDEELLPYPHTIVARSGVELIKQGLVALADFQDRKLRVGQENADHTLPASDSPVIAINGSLKEYKLRLEDTLDVFRLYKGKKPRKTKFKQYHTFHDFEQDVNDREMSEYGIVLSLIEAYEDDLPQVLATFDQKVLSQSTCLERADVILTTAHQAKGLEFDNVHVCDDFIPLDVCQKPPDPAQQRFSSATAASQNESQIHFKLNAWGDDLNLWYVAVTRAKKNLRLPKKWWDIVDLMDKVKKGEAVDQKYQNQLVAMRNLFDTFDKFIQ